MKYQPIPDEQAYRDLDGALVSPDTINKSKLPNLNYYFIGAAFGVLGLGLALLGIIRYGNGRRIFHIIVVGLDILYSRHSICNQSGGISIKLELVFTVILSNKVQRVLLY